MKIDFNLKNYINNKIIILIILLFLVLYSFFKCSFSKENFKSDRLDVSLLSIPSNIYLTYKNRECIPSKVFRNFNKFAPKYNIIFYDDNQCLEFLKNNYSSDVVNTYLRLKIKAHKADLFRYCILYKKENIFRYKD